MKARLLEDGGAGASDAEQFFRSPAFLAAESVTHTLAVEDELHLPIIVRDIEGTELRDAISP